MVKICFYFVFSLGELVAAFFMLTSMNPAEKKTSI